MKYKNAAEILPEKLLRELQSYSGGDILYIPKAGAKAGWGARNGSKNYYLERNQVIKTLHRDGKSADDLAQQYGLSVSTIKRILYH